MGIQQNYLYRVLPGLAEDGMVKKRAAAGTCARALPSERPDRGGQSGP